MVELRTLVQTLVALGTNAYLLSPSAVPEKIFSDKNFPPPVCQQLTEIIGEAPGIKADD